jgi:hypothetical protein
MEKLTSEDFVLSMSISQRSKLQELNEGLRSLLVHRLARGVKAVWRRSLSDEAKASAFCEPCKRWIRDVPLAEEFTHKACGRVYRVEFAVLEEVVDDDG